MARADVMTRCHLDLFLSVYNHTSAQTAHTRHDTRCISHLRGRHVAHAHASLRVHALRPQRGRRLRRGRPHRLRQRGGESCEIPRRLARGVPEPEVRQLPGDGAGVERVRVP